VGLLDGHRAIVTGGASGIGRAACRRMAEEGAVVAVLDRDEAGAVAVANEVGGHGFGVDVADWDSVDAGVASAVHALGGLSIVFNNAGIGGLSPLHEYPLDEWLRVIGVDLTGAWHVLRATVPHLLANGDGRIVNTASISGVRPAAGEAPYAAAKAGVAALTATAALEYAPTIRVNAISPGTIRSGLTDPLLQMPSRERDHRTRTPLARIGEPEDVADVVVFLCSDLARFITGVNLVVDGGMTLHGSGVDGMLDWVTAVSRGEIAWDGP